jgi:hypothetical protein
MTPGADYVILNKLRIRNGSRTFLSSSNGSKSKQSGTATRSKNDATLTVTQGVRAIVAKPGSSQNRKDGLCEQRKTLTYPHYNTE